MNEAALTSLLAPISTKGGADRDPAYYAPVNGDSVPSEPTPRKVQ